MKIILGLLILFILLSEWNQIIAQNNCDLSECHQFDFWLGDWKVSWQDSSGKQFEGRNYINKILDGCVIEENFDGNPGIKFKGKSLSVYNQLKNIWEQCWVDSQGGYMLFTGGMQNDSLVLSREVESATGIIFQRMVFYNIDENNFDWNWEVSKDNGRIWNLTWKIHYKRE